MTPRSRSRTDPCDRIQALNRLAQAEAFLAAAELVVEDGSDIAYPGVAGALAVLAGIAAADAACCARLGQRARGQAHAEARTLVATVAPHGGAMAKDLQRLLARKDSSQYGIAFVSAAEAARMMVWGRRLVATARRAVEA